MRTTAPGLLALGLAGIATACGGSASAPETGVAAPADFVPAPAPEAWFTDRAQETGIDFVHFNGMSGAFYFSEMMGSGGALFDYDDDGDLDAYLVQGQMLGAGRTLNEALIPPAGPGPLTDRLYRNDLATGEDGAPRLRFTDVTGTSGLAVGTYGMGVATGDFDNDGWTDLYRTRHGPNQLFRNNGDGTFTDVSRASGTDDPSWSLSASFVDFDRDGWLDLYVGNYVDYDPDREENACTTLTGEPDYCAPKSYASVPDRLYRNRRNGTFADVTAEARVGGDFGPALGVLTADFDADGWIDVYVANDGEPNRLWINGRNGGFADDALLAGVAVNGDGAAEASMGVDLGDFDGDGDDDLFMTHVATETNTLYVNDGHGFFEDRSAMTGLGPPSLPFTGFGAAWADFDNDGWLDLLVVNGAVRVLEPLVRVGDPFPLHQRNQVFRNVGDGRFEDVTPRAGPAFALSEVSRGAAVGDVDNDGDLDVLVTNNNAPARLLINNVGHRNRWIGLRLAGGRGPRDMLGARVGVFRDDGAVLWRRARADGSYASANDPRVLVGLADAAAVDRVRVVWPSGRVEEWTDVGAGRWTTLIEGSGRAQE